MLKKILIGLIISLGIFFAGSLAYLLALYTTLPDVRLLEGWTPPQASVVYDYRGRYYGDIGVQKRYYVSIDKIPQRLVQAFIAVEDRNFFSHSGIDFGAILRAAIANLKAGRVVQGGSTITQQLAKNLFLTRERTLKRKLKEALLAIKIERTFEKRKILELYLNQIYLGSGAYGVEAASRVYFGKSAMELTLEEAALLAGLPKAPAKFNPFVNPELAKVRRDYVLRRMLEENFITREEYESAVIKPVSVAGGEKKISDYVLDMVKEYLMERYGDLALQGGLKIYITIDRDLQALAVRSLKRGLLKLARIQGFPFLPESEKDLERYYVAQDTRFIVGRLYVAKVISVKDGKAEVSVGDTRFLVDTKGLNLEGRRYVFIRL
ncbi:MAG TPA: hypothetical protein EYP11_00825 [Aquificaceae bacterium]|nr:hypothetical protein [Aquificaceae bacterium]